MSDHFPCFISLPNVEPSITRNTIYSAGHSPTALAKFKEEINKANLSDLVQATLMSDPNKSYNNLYQVLSKAKALHILIKQVKFDKKKHKKSPWITKGIIKSLTCRDKLYRSFKQCRVGTEVYNTLKTNLHTFNRILKPCISSAKKVYYINVFNQYKFNIKKTCGTIKDLLNKKNNTSASPDSLNINGDLIKDKEKIADHFNNYIANIVHILSQQITANYNSNVSYSDFLDNSDNSRFEFSLVSESVIDKIINDISAKNGSGPDGINTKLLKLVQHNLISPLTNLVNQTLSTGIFPDRPKIAKVIPIYKKGDSLLAEYLFFLVYRKYLKK